MNTPGHEAALARAVVGVLAVSIAAVVIVLAGFSGLVYMALLALAIAPGLPLGFALFGPRHPGGWIAGLLFGYAFTSLAWWAVVFARIPSAAAFVLAWAVMCALVWYTARVLRVRMSSGSSRTSGFALVSLPPWPTRATIGLVALLLLVPILVGRPFAKLGSYDPRGDRLYRAYFIADFVWHTALTAELTKESQPPRNPYLVTEPVHYYWTYFRIPATLSRHAGFPVETALKLNALAAALLMVAAIYLAAWCALPDWPLVVGGAVALTVLSSSAEGAAATADLVRRGQPLSDLRDLNIDAIAAWAFKGLRIDGLPRAMWYTPQHSMAYALGLLAVPVAIASGAGASTGAIAVTGLALGASLAFNPLVGAFFCALYGVSVVVDAAVRSRLADIPRHAISVVPVLLAFAWCSLNQVGEGAVSALHFGFWGPARNATVTVFLLSFGPILIPMLLGLVVRTTPPAGRTSIGEPPHLVPAVAGVILSVLLMHLVTLTVDQAWVGFRGGHLFFVMAPALVAYGFITLTRRGLTALAIAVAAFVAVLGLPTTIVDAYNAQDVANLHMAPGDFHWTVSLTPAEQEALAWIQTNTAPDAVVQDEPIVRGRETWSLIPSWGERRMAGGNPLPLLNTPTYDERMRQVREIYTTDNAEAAWAAAKSMGIDYLYADATEWRAYPAVAKFGAHPEYFEPVFQNQEVTIWAVRRQPSG